MPSHCILFYSALQDLFSDRVNSENGSISGIPFTSKLAYADRFGINIDVFIDVMNHVDAHYITTVNNQLKRMSKANV